MNQTTSDGRIGIRELRYAYRREREREERKGFRVHGIVYACVNVVLITANLVFVPQFLWFLFPLLGWGLGLTMHYVLGVREIGRRIAKEEERLLTAAKQTRLE
jgi:hypothetical protein